MANRTDKEANAIHGTNPQNLVEYISRQKIYDSLYWKQECFGLSAERLVDKAVELKEVGGMYGEPQKPTQFICLILKMLQIQPDKDIIVEFIKNDDFKYLRVLGAFYMRLVGRPLDVYQYLEPLYNDYRKVRVRSLQGKEELGHVDELIDDMLHKDRLFTIALPRLPARLTLETAGQLEPRVSVLDEEFDEAALEEEQQEQAEALQQAAAAAEQAAAQQEEGEVGEEAEERERRREREKWQLTRDEKRERERQLGRRSRSRSRGRDEGRRERSRSRERRRRDQSRSRSRARDERRHRSRRPRSRSRDRRDDRRRRSRSRERYDDRDRRRDDRRERDHRDDRERERRRGRSASPGRGGGGEAGQAGRKGRDCGGQRPACQAGPQAAQVEASSQQPAIRRWGLARPADLPHALQICCWPPACSSLRLPSWLPAPTPLLHAISAVLEVTQLQGSFPAWQQAAAGGQWREQAVRKGAVELQVRSRDR